jgi:hypothetical protein
MRLAVLNKITNAVLAFICDQLSGSANPTQGISQANKTIAAIILTMIKLKRLAVFSLSKTLWFIS